MAEMDFFCNIKDCRKPLFSTAWITKCSHIFCEEHGNSITYNQTCPACKCRLPGNLDATLQNLDPPEVIKSMILTGLKPEVMIDIFGRSMAFRTYQVVQERAYYNSLIQSLQTQMSQAESVHKSQITKMENDLAHEGKNYQALLKENDSLKFRIQECERLLTEKSRQIQLMQMKYESLRCQTTDQYLQPNFPNFQTSSQKLVTDSQDKFKDKQYMTYENFLQGQSQRIREEASNLSDFNFLCDGYKAKRTPLFPSVFGKKEE